MSGVASDQCLVGHRTIGPTAVRTFPIYLIRYESVIRVISTLPSLALMKGLSITVARVLVEWTSFTSTW